MSKSSSLKNGFANKNLRNFSFLSLLCVYFGSFWIFSGVPFCDKIFLNIFLNSSEDNDDRMNYILNRCQFEEHERVETKAIIRG